ncbi:MULTISPECIES: AAA family ATPase [unclassified Blastococcus]|uniref:AAA family ATPase n=1 Tax=unclassified Blastococcus TaxID=2619396 RepID=UPI001EF03405|nr:MULTISPECIES: AAA family ATPase [unclassified Blastococcus]
MRRRPYSVVLFDEVEKAHPDVFNTLLQVLDDGRLTDSQGRTVDFRSTVSIMTSNLGSELIVGRHTPLGFGNGGEGVADESLRDRLMRRLRESFRPEFLNRIDEIVVFRQLERTQLERITDLLLEETRRRLRAQGIELDVSPEAVSWLAERGFEPQFGARPLRRAIQREVDNRLSRLLLDGRVRSGQRVHAVVGDGRLDFEVAVEAIIQNWWRQGMMGGAKAHHDGVVAFSQTDFTDDLKKITVPVLVMHGDDDQVVPYAGSAPRSAELLPNGTLRTYSGFPHGMPTTQAGTINADLLAFLQD